MIDKRIVVIRSGTRSAADLSVEHDDALNDLRSEVCKRHAAGLTKTNGSFYFLDHTYHSF